MTIEEAIKHCEEVAEREQQKGYYANTEANQSTEYGTKCYECAKEHRQLAEWLRELKALKDNDDVKDVFKGCDTCKYLNIDADDYPCDRCMHRYINQYKYDITRGVNTDETFED